MTAGYDVRLTAAAEQDLIDIVQYARTHVSPSAAASLLDTLLACIETLERQPGRGAIPPELQGVGLADYRQIRSGRYRLIYRFRESAVMVMVVADHRRDMQALLERRLFGA